MRRYMGACLLIAAGTAFAGGVGDRARQASAEESSAHRVQEIFLELEEASENSRRRTVAAATLQAAPIDPAVLTRIRRKNSNGRFAYGNATLVAGGQCHWIAAAAGHSILDHRYSRLANRGDIAVKVPGGEWINPVEMVTPPELHWSSDEIDDWALLVLVAPRCEFDQRRTFSTALPHLQTRPLSAENIRRCLGNVQMLCYHYDQGLVEGKRMLERGCQMQQMANVEPGAGSTGYLSCKVDYGVSGCSPVCVSEGLWLNLGVFSKGLKRHDKNSYPQPVGAFRFYDGEFAEALENLKRKYGMRP